MIPTTFSEDRERLLRAVELINSFVNDCRLIHNFLCFLALIDE